MKSIALKAIHGITALLLKKPNKISNPKYHVPALERRLELYYWEKEKY